MSDLLRSDVARRVAAILLVWAAGANAAELASRAAGAGWIGALAAFVALLMLPGMELERLLRRSNLVFHAPVQPLRAPADWRTVARTRFTPPPRRRLRDRLAVRWRTVDAAERSLAAPARFFAYSVGLLAGLAIFAVLLGLAIGTVVVLMLLLTLGLALVPAPPLFDLSAQDVDRAAAPHLPASRTTPAPAGATDTRRPPAYIAFFQTPARPPEAAREQPPTGGERTGEGHAQRLVLLLFVAMAATMAWMSLGGDNVARDRMWYMAYVTHLSDADAVSWGEPFFGTGNAVARFACNAWLVSLAAWKTLGGLPTPFVFERVAPFVVTLLLASASLGLARTLGRPARAAPLALAMLLVPLASDYPFFGVDRTLLFSRLAEDKTVALLVLVPVAIAVALECIAGGLGAPIVRTGSRRATIAACATVLAAVAFTHPLVFLLLGISLVPLLVWVGSDEGRDGVHAALRVLALCAIVAALPAWLGWHARAAVLAESSPSEVSIADARNPVVRSHDRMERLIDIGHGGPIVDPRLIDEPLLLLALLGVLVALRRHRALWARYVLAATLPALALAFTPYVAPAFGRIVVPWMAYRALWAVPFGVALGALLRHAPAMLATHRSSRAVAAAVLVLLTAANAWPRIPWQRLDIGQARKDPERLDYDRELYALFAAVRLLPDDSVIAAAAGLSELLPTYTGRHVLAFSDRGTTVFAGSVDAAAARMRASAALVGLRGGSFALRDGLAAKWKVTHRLYEGGTCEPGATVLYRSTRFALCREPEARVAAASLAHQRAAPVAGGSDSRLLVSLGGDLRCSPHADVEPAAGDEATPHKWRRAWRWTGRPVAVTCEASLPVRATTALVRLRLHLPRARESIVYRIESRTSSGETHVAEGAVDFEGTETGEIRVPGERVNEVSVRLTPAFLPYLNVELLEIRAG